MLLIVAVGCTARVNAQLKIGQPVPDIKLPVILNAKQSQISLNDLKGKVIWLEFWATWCSPCVEAMPHLQQMQKQFSPKLQVIAISSEKEKRIVQFLQNKPFNLWFAVDTGDMFQQYFPYRTIPHAVLIGPDGKIAAITEPGNITAATIDDLLKGKTIDLPVKQDNLSTDPVHDYFFAADTVTRRFLMQPQIAGLGSSSRSYLSDSVFRGRRLTVFNLTLQGIYRIAYGDVPHDRTLDLTPKPTAGKGATMYCMDIIVPKGQENSLYPTLLAELKSRFDLNAAFEKQNKKVYVLKIADSSKVRQLKISAAGAENFSARDGQFDGQHGKLAKVADYLESFGVVKAPVVDETGDDKYYDIDFNFQPEKGESLTDALAGLGLKLEQGEREIDVLVFRPKE